MKLLALFVVCSSLLFLGNALEVIKGNRNGAPLNWEIDGPAHSDEVIRFSIQLPQCNLDTLFDMVRQVSDPDSPKWRQFMSVEEMNAVTFCPEDHGKIVAKWLEEEGVSKYHQEGNTIRARATVETVARLFDTDFYEFVHMPTDKRAIRQLGSFSIPSYMDKHIDMITGISEFFYDTKYRAPAAFDAAQKEYQELEVKDPAVPGPFFINASDIYVTPALLVRTYNISAIEPGTKNLQGIAAFDDYYDSTALCTFQTAIMQDFDFIPDIDYKGFMPGNEGNTSADETESDLDIQYITALGRGITTEFWSQDPGYWILDWAEGAVQASDDGPYVWSVSYGWPEVWECADYPFNVTTCPTGYDSADYVERTNTELAKFALLGVSVLVASGDDGAVGFSQNCPLSPNTVQPGTNYNCSQALPNVESCGCATLVIEMTNGSRCVFPLGTNIYPDCEVVANEPDCNQAFAKLGAAPNCQINQSDFIMPNGSSTYPYFYSDCQCNQLPNVTIGTCTVRGYLDSVDGANYPVFYSDFPAASPYVTTVGATQFRIGLETCENDMIDEPEHIVSPFTFGFNAGGGFSAYAPQPWWQNVTTPAYFNTPGAIPPSYAFNTSGRGYPDISFNGHNFVTVLGVISAARQFLFPTADFGTIEEIQGTSASSPSLAGAISLLNSYLLNNGQPTLGFLNPLLYKMAAEKPNTFHDILPYTYNTIPGGGAGQLPIVANNCSRFGCCEWAYAVTPGWDASSGLGTPNFGEILSYLSTKTGLPMPEAQGVVKHKKH